MTHWRTLALMALFSVDATACTVVYPNVDTGPAFRVKVLNQGRPVSGLRIRLGKNSSVTTGADGIARFAGVPPGNYFLTAHDDAGIPDAVTVVVKASGPADVTVPLRWPSGKVVAVRSASGMMRGPDSLPVQASLSLVEALSARVLSEVHTDDQARFDFGSVSPGLYFIRLGASMLRDWAGHEIHGLIPIEVSPHADAPTLDLDLGWTSCGLNYVDTQQCPHADLSVEQLCGEVVDSTGAAISDAEILVLESGGKSEIVKRVDTDSRGAFHAGAVTSGTYRLVVRASGFSPLRRIVNVRGGAPAECTRSLSVRLEIGGGCSTVE